MFIDRFVNIISAVIGFAGAIFLLKGVLHLSPDLIAKLSQTYFDFSLVQLQNLSSQKADIVSGAFLVSLAFVIQILGLLLLREPFSVFEGYWFAALLAAAVSLLIVIVFIGINRGLTRHYEQQAKVMLAKWQLEQTVKRVAITPVDVRSVEQYTQTLLGIKREQNENGAAFIRRIAGQFKVSLPESFRVEGE
jgi:hypothetical protein